MRLAQVQTTPNTEAQATTDGIEELEHSHANAEAPVGNANVHNGEPSTPRKVRITPKDVQRVGKAPNCPTCNFHRADQTARARHASRTEMCSKYELYDLLARESVAEMIVGGAQGRRYSYSIEQNPETSTAPMAQSPLSYNSQPDSTTSTWTPDSSGGSLVAHAGAEQQSSSTSTRLASRRLHRGTFTGDPSLSLQIRHRIRPHIDVADSTDFKHVVTSVVGMGCALDNPDSAGMLEAMKAWVLKPSMRLSVRVLSGACTRGHSVRAVARAECLSLHTERRDRRTFNGWQHPTCVHRHRLAPLGRFISRASAVLPTNTSSSTNPSLP